MLGWVCIVYATGWRKVWGQREGGVWEEREGERESREAGDHGDKVGIGRKKMLSKG